MSRIFISGSSTGLGLMAADLLVSQGHQVVLHARDAGRGLYGARKVWHHLRREGHQVPRCQVERLMRQAGLRGVRRGRQFVTTRADAKAYSAKVQGEAEASAIRNRGDALRDNPGLPALVTAEKWDGHLPTTMVPGGAVPFLKVNPGGG